MNVVELGNFSEHPKAMTLTALLGVSVVRTSPILKHCFVDHLAQDLPRLM